jgi:hypothetical protein
MNSLDTVFEEIAGDWLKGSHEQTGQSGRFFLRRFAAARSVSLFLEGK